MTTMRHMRPQPEPDQLLLNRAQACHVLNIGLSTYKSLVAQGRIHEVRIGTTEKKMRALVSVDELKRFFETLK